MNDISLSGWKIPHFKTSAAVVGSGAAGYNAADTLYSLGVTDVLIITEGRMMGTSRPSASICFTRRTGAPSAIFAPSA